MAIVRNNYGRFSALPAAADTIAKLAVKSAPLRLCDDHTVEIRALPKSLRNWAFRSVGGWARNLQNNMLNNIIYRLIEF